ncbi:acidic leucine-rich nuclear phosphoprotein 32 family member B-like [Branchiostoma lanceolatum]|uniref:acidic leucine-rich nuclear phosphoprotein 32 family member B-like n=1 Tax=Branchiostoma lanceolatum TaxID=7740 RepID=UPI00345432D5
MGGEEEKDAEDGVEEEEDAEDGVEEEKDAEDGVEEEKDAEDRMEEEEVAGEESETEVPSKSVGSALAVQEQHNTGSTRKYVDRKRSLELDSTKTDTDSLLESPGSPVKRVRNTPAEGARAMPMNTLPEKVRNTPPTPTRQLPQNQQRSSG